VLGGPSLRLLVEKFHEAKLGVSTNDLSSPEGQTHHHHHQADVSVRASTNCPAAGLMLQP
jgi:hypothetical protein